MKAVLLSRREQFVRTSEDQQSCTATGRRKMSCCVNGSCFDEEEEDESAGEAPLCGGGDMTNRSLMSC